MSQVKNKAFFIDYIKAIKAYIKGLYSSFYFKILNFLINLYHKYLLLKCAV